MTVRGSIVGWGRDVESQITSIPAGIEWRSIDAHLTGGLAISSTGAASAWGGNVPGAAPAHADFAVASLGNNFAAGIRADGSLYAWGADTSSVVTNTNAATGTDWVEVVCGGFVAIGRRSDGSLEAFGDDTNGLVTDCPATTGWAQVATQGNHAIALHSDGSLHAWGLDTSNEVSNTPTTGGWAQVQARSQGSFALHSDGTITYWGTAMTTNPVAGGSFVAIAGGGSNLMALRSNGSFAVFGSDAGGFISDSPGGGDGWLILSRVGSGAWGLAIAETIAATATEATRGTVTTILSAQVAVTATERTRGRAYPVVPSPSQNLPGRKPWSYVEIDMPRCSLIYGNAPCLATLGTTGDHKCHNTFATCQDPTQFDPETFTLRFGIQTPDMPRGLQVLPFLQDVRSAPARTNPGGIDRDSTILGMRARVTVTLDDPPYSDLWTDPYQDERLDGTAQADGIGYDPFDRGTYWGKLRARWPYHEGAEIRVFTGYLGDPLDTYKRRTYYIERISGSPGQQAQIVAKDILILADRASAPPPSRGTLGWFARQTTRAEVIGGSISPFPPHDAIFHLPNSVASTSEEARLAYFQRGAPRGRAAGDDTPIGWARVGDEIFGWRELAAVPGTHGFPAWQLQASTLTRHAFDTVEYTYEVDDLGALRYYAAHNEGGVGASATFDGDLVQHCYYWQSRRPDEIIADLLLLAGVAPRFIPFAAWRREWVEHMSSPMILLSRMVTEPTKISTLIREVCENAGCYIWWDEEREIVQFRALKNAATLTALASRTLTDRQHLIEDSIAIQEKPDQRMSQVWVHWDLLNPIQSPGEIGSYTRTLIQADALAERDIEYGDQKIRTIFAPWFSIVGADVNRPRVEHVAELILERSRNTPRSVSIQLDAKDGDINVGDPIILQTRKIQDATGQDALLVCEVVSRSETSTAHRYQYSLAVVGTA